MRYVDAAGRTWHVDYDPPPVPTCAWDWQGGDEDGEIPMKLGRTVFAVLDAIDEDAEELLWEEHAEDPGSRVIAGDRV